MSTEIKRKIYFPNLDGLRFFSFLIVFLTHSLSTENPSIQSSSWYRIIKLRMFSDGEIGVSFFFVLSGFLISYLLLVEKEITGRIDVKAFYIRRILRIWPLYYFVVLFSFFLFPLLKSYFGQVPNETSNPFLCFTFLNNFNRIYNGDSDSSILTMMWSVAIEEQFYLIWPVLFYLISVRKYKFIFIAVFLVSTLFRVFSVHKTQQDWQHLDWHTLGVISDMAIGGFGAYLVINSKSFLYKVQHLSKGNILLIYLLTLSFIVFKKEIFSVPAMQIFKRVLMASTFIMVILEQNYSQNSFFKVGNWKVISWLGKYTYGLYCLHGIGVLICVTLLNKFSLNHFSWQIWLLQVPFSLLISICISWLSFSYFESWFLQLKSRFSYITRD